MKILIPGSFDPPTNGHIDVINRCSEIFNEIIVGRCESIKGFFIYSRRKIRNA